MIITNVSARVNTHAKSVTSNVNSAVTRGIVNVETMLVVGMLTAQAVSHTRKANVNTS